MNNVAGRYGVSAMPTFVFFKNGKPTPVAAQGLKAGPSVVFTDDGLVDRLRGADPVALKAVVQSLAGKVKATTDIPVNKDAGEVVAATGGQ